MCRWRAPNDYFILELMLKDEDKPRARGCLEIYDGLGDLPVRRIQFNETNILAIQTIRRYHFMLKVNAIWHKIDDKFVINNNIDAYVDGQNLIVKE